MSDGHEARDLLGAWALDAVDDVERRTVERAIAEDDDLAAEARAMRETVARLAEADTAPAPEELRERVLAGAAASPQRGSAERSTSEGTSGQSRRNRGASRWMLAAAAAAAVLIPTGIAVQQADRAGSAEDRLQEFTEALARPEAELLTTEIAGGGRAAALVSDQEVLFAASAVPELGEDSTYQLWLIDDGGPSSAGILSVEDGRLEARLAALPSGGALAMTVEPAGGSLEPTTDPILVLGG